MCRFPNFSAQGIIPNIVVAFQACFLYWGTQKSDCYSFGILYSWGSIIGYAISRILNRGIIITKILAFQACSLLWGHLEKRLIQFLNPLTHWEQSYHMRFLQFFNMVNYFQWNKISLPGKSWVRSSSKKNCWHGCECPKSWLFLPLWPLNFISISVVNSMDEKRLLSEFGIN